MRVTLLLIMAAAFAVGGCVTRELVITSEPAGAAVTINDTHHGVTPMTYKFLHYETLGILFEREGYHPLYVKETIRPPAYERPGIDFVSEALWPGKLHDRRELNVQLEEIGDPDDMAALLERAKAKGDEVHAAAARRIERDKERKPLKVPLLEVREKVREEEESKTEPEPEPEANEEAPANVEAAAAVEEAPVVPKADETTKAAPAKPKVEEKVEAAPAAL